jgi:hypothetical protein
MLSVGAPAQEAEDGLEQFGRGPGGQLACTALRLEVAAGCRCSEAHPAP